MSGDWKSDCLPGVVGADYRPCPLRCPLTVGTTARNLHLVEIKVWPNKKCYRGLFVCPHFAVMSSIYMEFARQLRKRTAKAVREEAAKRLCLRYFRFPDLAQGQLVMGKLLQKCMVKSNSNVC